MFKGAGANALRTVGSALVLVLYGEIKTAMGFEGNKARPYSINPEFESS